jgi:hypothetical protein
VPERPDLRAERFTDDTRMPFGKYRGQALRDVPAAYLLWLGDNLVPDNYDKTAILVYINESRRALEMDAEEDREIEKLHGRQRDEDYE